MIHNKEHSKGITIIALVVTVIVLLILAGVTLGTLSGENGIIGKAQKAKEEYKKAQYQEAINLAVLQTHTEQGKYKIEAKKVLERVREILKKNELFKDIKEVEDDKAWKITYDGDHWKLTIITIEGWDFYVTEEQTKYIGTEEEIKKVELIDGDIIFEYNNEWTKGPVEVSIRVAKEEYQQYEMQYSYDQTYWYPYKEELTIEDNFKHIYVRLKENGKVITKKDAHIQITNIDRLEPEEFEITKENVTTTTDSITVIGRTEDQKETEIDGKSGIVQYWFSKDGGANWVTNENRGETNYTFTGLTQKTTYKLKMKAIDEAGNETETEELEITTEEIPNLREDDNETERANIIFSHNPVGWTNGNVEVTIDTSEKGFILQYNKGDRNKEEEWKNYSAPVVMTENGSIYARLKDSSNNIGEAIEHKITTIERIKPTIKIQANTTAVSKTKQITITAQDTGGSGLLNANYYQYYLSTSQTQLLGGSWQNYTSGTAFTIGSGITGTRYVWVKQIADNAGNKSETNNSVYHVSDAYTFDNTAPTCTISPNIGTPPTNASSITYTFTFSEAVTGFTIDDITVTNGTKGTFRVISSTQYTLNVTNSGR